MSQFTSSMCLLPLVGTLLLSGIHGYEKGAPLEACASMKPNHYGANYKKPDGTEPFKVVVSQSTYSKDDILAVEIKSTSNSPANTVEFKGFMLQARSPNGTNVGTFFADPRMYQLLSCNGVKSTAVTHTKKLTKKKPTKTESHWVPLDGTQENVTFWATVVEHKDNVFLELKSEMVSYVEESGAQSMFSVSVLSLVVWPLLSAALWWE